MPTKWRSYIVTIDPMYILLACRGTSLRATWPVLLSESVTNPYSSMHGIVLRGNRHRGQVPCLGFRVIVLRFRVQLLCTYADNVALPAFARRMPLCRAATDRYLLLEGGLLAAAVKFAAACQAGTDRQTDRRTDTVPFHRSCSATMRAMPIIISGSTKH